MKNIYFIRSGKFIKIGSAEDVAARLAQLQTGNPTQLQLITQIRNVPELLEGQFHRAFIEDHHSGEWFRFSRTLRKVMILIAHGAAPKTPHAIEVLRQFAPKQGLGAGLGLDPEHLGLGKGAFDITEPKVVGLRSRSA